MNLPLTKPLVVFDIETTGLDITRDRIIQLSYIRVLPTGEEQRNVYLINPERPLPKDVEELTHITNEMLRDAPTFKQLAPALRQVFSDCDVAGYNINNFDMPLLAEEFIRADIDIDLSRCRLVDGLQIYRLMERRNLAAAYKFYCGRKMEDDFRAHRADEDTEATWRVLQAQFDMYSAERQQEPERVLPRDMDALHTLLKHNDNIDFAGRIVWKEVTDSSGRPLLTTNGTPLMKEAFNFGKYKGHYVEEVFNSDPSYYNWMMNADFPQYTKRVLTRLRLKYKQSSVR